MKSSTEPTLTPIARWDTVPYQRIDAGKTLNVGVVAFSGAGIQKVSFAIDGQGYSGPSPIDATGMTLNPQSGVWEYWIPISAADFGSDGQVLVEATVYGNDGGVRDKDTGGGSQGLDALSLSVNPNGTLPARTVYVATDGNDTTGDGSESNPYATVAKGVLDIYAAQSSDCGGGTIYLLPGTHTPSHGGSYGDYAAANEWMTVSAAPGYGPDDVTMISGGGKFVRKLRFRNLTLRCTSDSAPVVWNMGTTNRLSTYLWIDSCAMIGRGREYTTNEHPLYIRYDEQFTTDSSISDVNEAFYGLDMTAMICRGLNISTISGDAFRNVPFVVNCVVNDINPLETGTHADVLQIYGSNASSRTADNLIYYNLRATDCEFQGFLFTGDETTSPDQAQGIALVNVSITGGDYFHNFIGLWVDHLLMWHCTLDKPFRIYARDYTGYGAGVPPRISHFFARGNCFAALQVETGEDSATDYSEWFQNHFQTVSGPYVARGTNYTTGDPLLANTMQPICSPLARRVREIVVPVDINGTARMAPTSVGAYEVEAWR